MSFKIYFAGAIAAGRDDAATYEAIINELSHFGEVLTPQFGDQGMSQAGEPLPAGMIHDRDLEWIKGSDVLVAEVSTPSLGVGYQIGKASEWGKPVLCLYRPDPNSPLSKMIIGDEEIVYAPYQMVLDIPDILNEFFSLLERVRASQ